MDSITQGLLGATIAEAGFREKLGGRAVVWGALVAVAPDLDLVAAIGGEWSTMIHHRGVSHSWICETLAAPLLGWLAWRFVGKREGSWWRWAHLTWWALVTHPALDVCTSYGTQLFAPFSTYRYAIDAVSIVDPVYSLPLLVAVIASRRSEVRARARKIAIGALVFSTLYLGLGFGLSQRAIATAEEELAREGFEPVETRALPTFANQVVHRVIARDDQDRFRLALLGPGSPTPLEWVALEQDRDPLVRSARASEVGHILEWHAMGFACFDLEATDAGHDVVVNDLRYGLYGDLTRSFMGARFHYDLEGRVIDAERVRRERDDLDAGAELEALWRHF